MGIQVHWVIVGGGFKGMLAATILLQQDQQVTLIEKGKALGGVMRGIDWNGYHLDLGCQIFDNSFPDVTAYLFAIMNKNVCSLDVKYAGMTAGRWSENYTIPDLTKGPLSQETIKAELAAIKAHASRLDKNLSDYLNNRYGEHAATMLIEAARKKLQFDPGKLDASAANILFFERVKLFEDACSKTLKQDTFYDERLGLYSDTNSMLFYPEAAKFYPHRNFYPQSGGMRGFCDSATHHLQEKGAELIFEQAIQQVKGGLIKLESGKMINGDKLIWAADSDVLQSVLLGENTLKQFIHPVPMVVVYFEVAVENIGQYTYVHDHTPEHLIFRASTPGIYSNQIIDGKSYICCEVPTSLNSDVWQNAVRHLETIWQEACNLRVCSGDMPDKYKLLQAPVTFKLPLLGYQAEFEKVRQQLRYAHSDIMWIDPVHTSLTNIATNILKEIQN